MFLLALVYLIILVVWAIFSFRSPVPEGGSRLGGVAQFILFCIIGFVLFWNILNK